MNNNPDSSDSSKENSFQGLWPPPLTTTNVVGDNETRSRSPSINMPGRHNETPPPPPVAGDHDETCPRPTPPPTNIPAAAANETRPHPRPNLNVPGSSETHEKPKKKKKKTREIIVGGDPVMTTLRLGCDPNMQFVVGSTSKKPKPVKKVLIDLNAPLITCPCYECDKTFWSLKALFGHMRCHPERGWRGIIPPEKRRKRNKKNRVAASADPQGSGFGRVDMNEEDQEVATGLLMLANGLLTMDTTQIFNDHQGSPETVDSGVAANENHVFECSSCKRVFGSHQALGGHRASHKKVKGCFAIAAENSPSDESNNENRNNEDYSNGKGKGKGKVTEQGLVSGHRCGICGKIFASGQALGGHMRCHWDRGENSSSSSMMFQPQQQQGGMFNPSTAGCSTSYANRGERDGTANYALDLNDLDLNMPPPLEPQPEPEAAPAPPVDDHAASEDSSSSSTSSSEMDLDLKLGF